MTNVIVFPKGKKNAPPQTMEEVIESVEMVRKEHVEFIVDDCCSFIFGRLSEEGFDLSDEGYEKQIVLVAEALKSVLYSASGIEHPLQTFAAQMQIEYNHEEYDEPADVE